MFSSSPLVMSTPSFSTSSRHLGEKEREGEGGREGGRVRGREGGRGGEEGKVREEYYRNQLN